MVGDHQIQIIPLLLGVVVSSWSVESDHLVLPILVRWRAVVMFL
jgi:hypothetical protein